MPLKAPYYVARRDDPPPWMPAPENLNVPTAIQLQVLTPTTVVQAPLYIPKGDQEIRVWFGQPVATDINTLPQPVVSTLQTIPPFVVPRPAEQQPWIWQAPFNPQMGNKPKAGPNPFFKLWRYDYVPQPDWQMPAEWMSSGIIQALHFKPTSPQKLWRWDADYDVRLWLGTPQPSNILHELGFKPTSPAKLWRWDCDSDVRTWSAQPVPTNIDTFPVQVVSTLQTIPRLWCPDPQSSNHGDGHRRSIRKY